MSGGRPDSAARRGHLLVEREQLGRHLGGQRRPLGLALGRRAVDLGEGGVAGRFELALLVADRAQLLVEVGQLELAGLAHLHDFEQLVLEGRTAGGPAR